MQDNPLRGREIIFEYIPVGAYMKVSAMDTRSLTEVIIQGPKGADEETLKRNAMKRLEYVMRKKGLL